MAFSKRSNIALVAGFRCSLLAEEMRHMDRHQQLIKNRRTQTNKVAANWRGEEGGGGECCTEVECFLVLLLLKRQLFPPAEQCKGWYCPWHGLGCKAHLEWTFPWWVVGAVTHYDFFTGVVPWSVYCTCSTLWSFIRHLRTTSKNVHLCDGGSLLVTTCDEFPLKWLPKDIDTVRKGFHRKASGVVNCKTCNETCTPCFKKFH